AEENSAHRAARHWVHQFARTLKTCRLYESSDNPTVAKFLEDLTASARQFTADHGALALRFSADDVVYDGVSLYFARSRDDNLALPFYRDGVRGLTINDDVTRGEIHRLIGAIVPVTSPVQTDDALVTLLWEAHLDHVDIDYVPAEGDVNGGIEAEEGDAVPWPDAEDEAGPEEA